MTGFGIGDDHRGLAVVAGVQALFPLQPVEAGREKKRYWFAANGVDISLESYAKVRSQKRRRVFDCTW